MSSVASTSILGPSSSNAYVSLLLSTAEKPGAFHACSKYTGRLHWNTWEATPHVSSVPFTSGTEGYACFKIPSLLRTAAGTLLAFSEARTPDCGDFARTDTVYKRSVDGGRSWGPLTLLVQVPREAASGLCGHPMVVGNIAPVQLHATSERYPNRILVPYARNNFEIWIIHSDDDGITFVNDRLIPNVTITDRTGPECDRGMSYFGFDVDRVSIANAGDFLRWAQLLCNQHDPYHNAALRSKLSGPWQFIGIGPPGSLQLRESGRILVPGYHSYVRGLLQSRGTIATSQLYNDFALAHVMISDDFGDTWRLGTSWPIGQGGNENQLVQLGDGSVLSNSRSFATGSTQFRLQARSMDAGETFSASTYVYEQPQGFNGCQGSTISSHESSNTVFVAGPDPPHPNSVVQELVDRLGCGLNMTGRSHLTLWKSVDGGRSYPQKWLLDPGLSAQSSLQTLPNGLALLYEQADPKPGDDQSASYMSKLLGNLEVLLPTRFVYREVLLSAGTENSEPAGLSRS